MDIKFVKGSKRKLRSKFKDSKLAERVLDRLQIAVPHLKFGDWRVSNRKNNDLSDVVEKDQRRRLHIKIAADSLMVESSCHRHDQKVVSSKDKFFLKFLSDESSKILAGKDFSLTNYGAEAVSNYLTSFFKLDAPPLPIFHFLRGISQQTYENQRIPYGIIIIPNEKSSVDDESLVSASENKRIKHLTDGYSTAFLLDGKGKLIGIEALPIVVEKGASSRRRPNWFANIAKMASDKKGIGIALNRNGDILVAIDGKLAFSQRSGIWKRWDHAEIIRLLQTLPRFEGQPWDFTDVLTYIYQVSLDLSFRRSGGLFVILQKRADKKHLLSPKEEVGSSKKEKVDCALDECLKNLKIYDQGRQLTADLASLDGAIVIDRNGNLVSYGQVLRIANRGGSGEQGARTRAAAVSSKYGLAIKISSDGDISFYAEGDKKFEI